MTNNKPSRELQLAQRLEKILIEIAIGTPQRKTELKHVVDYYNREYKLVTGRDYKFKYGDFEYNGRLK